MNIIKSLTARIEEYRTHHKNPCKNYATEANAEKATAETAAKCAQYFCGEGAEPANYVVFYVEAWGRWVGCINLSEVINRKGATGGYMGMCGDIFTW